MEWATLNIFQRLVRQWDALHPYNAAQIIRLNRHPPLETLDQSWSETLRVLGLGRVRAEGTRYRFESLNGDPAQLHVHRFGQADNLPALVTAELNRRFDPDADLPVRPFVLDAGDCCHLGIIYHHWVGDSASIRILLREWFYRLHDPASARRRPLRVAEGGYWGRFGPTRGRWRLGEGLLSSLRWSSRMKRVRRVERCDFDNYRTTFTLYDTPDGFVDAILHATRGRGVTLHDVFLAAAARVCDGFNLVRWTPRRQDLALGTIVDLRARTRDNLSDVFGLYLGFSSVLCRPRELRDWDRLLERIALQNRINKHRGVPEASMIRMAAGLVAHRMLGPEKVKHFYRKRLPLAGGVSNVNLNGDWPQRYHPDPILDYIRVSPSGPMMPLVFTPTTLGGRMNFGLTCRDSVVAPDRAAAIADAFRAELVHFAARRA